MAKTRHHTQEYIDRDVKEVPFPRTDQFAYQVVWQVEYMKGDGFRRVT
jgi:hypothetical protein